MKRKYKLKARKNRLSINCGVVTAWVPPLFSSISFSRCYQVVLFYCVRSIRMSSLRSILSTTSSCFQFILINPISSSCDKLRLLLISLCKSRFASRFSRLISLISIFISWISSRSLIVSRIICGDRALTY